MFSPFESQVIVLSKEIPIVSVGLRNAEVAYMNQNKTAWTSEVEQILVDHEFVSPGRVKDNKGGMCWFSAKHASLKI